MPHFYFHTETDVRTTDIEGIKFPGYEEAKHEAIRTAGQMMQDAPKVFWGSRPWNVSVTDADGLIMWEIYLDGQTSAAGRALEPNRKGEEPDGPTIIQCYSFLVGTFYQRKAIGAGGAIQNRSAGKAETAFSEGTLIGDYVVRRLFKGK